MADPGKSVPTTKSTENDQVFRALKKPPGPDRGWAWVVAFACFIINFILAGLARSSGVLYVALIELYGVSREAATTPFSMRVCVRNLAGPIVGMLGQRYGIRCMTLIGGVLAGCGGILCYFAPSVTWLTFFWGVINGFGFGFSTVIHMMAINHYFDRYKGTALGLAYSGDCIGTFVLPALMEFLIATYGVKETFLLIGAIVLNVIPMAMLLRPPPWNPNDIKKQSKAISGNVNHAYVDGEITHSVAPMDHSIGFQDSADTSQNGIIVVSQILPLSSSQQQIPQSTETYCSDRNCSENGKADDTSNCHVYGNSLKLPPAPPDDYRPSTSFSTAVSSIRLVTNSNTDAAENDDPPSYDSEMMSNSSKLTDICESAHQDYGTLHRRRDSITEIHFENVSRSGSVSNRSCMTATIKDHCNIGETFIKIRALSETLRNCSDSNRSSFTDKNYALATKSIRSSISSEANRNCDIIEVSRELKMQNGEQLPVVRISYENEAASSKGNQHTELCLDARKLVADNGKTELEITTLHRHEDVVDINNTGFDRLKRVLGDALIKAFHTNRKPIYLLICLTFGAFVLTFVSVITVVIDFAVDKGISEDNGKYLIIAFSAADLAGRLGFGVIIDKGWIEMKNYVALTNTIMGFFIAVMPFANGFLLLMLGMAFCGFIQGGAAIVYPIVIEKYMHKDEQSIAMGWLSFYGGILMFAMAPMIGFFRDNYGTYDGMFYIDGIMTMAIGLIWFLEPLLLRCQSKYCADPKAEDCPQKL